MVTDFFPGTLASLWGSLWTLSVEIILLAFVYILPFPVPCAIRAELGLVFDANL